MSESFIHRRVLGRYRVIRPLAEGGMGMIYLGRSEGAAGFSKPVVIKRIIPDYSHEHSDAEEFFVREARILSQIRHPGIVDVVDFGQEDGAYLMILEYVHGFNLGQWLKYHRKSGRPFSADLAIHIMSLVLDALHYAHRLKGPTGEIVQVVHRDVTPSNVLVDVEGAVKLADFGIARIAKGEDDKTTSGLVRGKVSYVAPELFTGIAANVKTDVYAAGVMLHELLVGRNELRADTPELTVRRVLEHQLTPPSRVRSDVSSRLDAVVAKATTKDPRDRFHSAEALLEALLEEAVLSQMEGARRMRASVPTDFLGAMPEVLGLEQLDVLERSWRAAARSEPPGPSAAQPPDEDPTTIARLTQDAPRRESKPAIRVEPASMSITLSLRSPQVVVAASAFTFLVITSITAALVFGRIGGARSEPAYLVVGHRDAPATPGGARTTLVATRPETTETTLASTFALRENAVRHCLETKANRSVDPAAIELVFRIEASGRVSAAALLPETVQRTALGRCLLDVAWRTSFPVQARAMEWGTPLLVRRGEVESGTASLGP